MNADERNLEASLGLRKADELTIDQMQQLLDIAVAQCTTAHKCVVRFERAAKVASLPVPRPLQYAAAQLYLALHNLRTEIAIMRGQEHAPPSADPNNQVHHELTRG